MQAGCENDKFHGEIIPHPEFCQPFVTQREGDTLKKAYRMLLALLGPRMVEFVQIKVRWVLAVGLPYLLHNLQSGAKLLESPVVKNFHRVSVDAPSTRGELFQQDPGRKTEETETLGSAASGSMTTRAKKCHRIRGITGK